MVDRYTAMNTSLPHRAIRPSHVLLLVAPFVAAGCSSDDDSPMAPDRTAPSFASFVQNRTLDATGQTVSITFSEAVTALTAEVPGTYTVSGGLTVNSATLRPAGNVVDLGLDGPVLPGANTVSVAAGIEDAAGNASAEVMAAAITSTDTVAPTALTIAGATIAGPENDTITVVFDDDMIEAEVETAGSWTIESPLGTPFDITGASIDYVAATRTATVILDAGSADQDLRTRDDIHASFTGMRDLGANTIATTAIGTTAVNAIISGDNSPPTILAAAPGAGNTLVLTFSEAVSGVETADLQSGPNPEGTELILTDASDPGAAAAGTIELLASPFDGNTVTISDGTTSQTFEFDFAFGQVGLSGVPNDGDSVTISDGAAPLTFEFESAGGIAGDVAVTIGGDADATITNLISAVNGTALNVTALATGLSNLANIRNDAVGAAGNVTITGTDSAGVQTLMGMSSGGIAGDVAVAVDHSSIANTVTNLRAAIDMNAFNVTTAGGSSATDFVLTNDAVGVAGNVPITVTEGSTFSVTGMTDGRDVGTATAAPTLSAGGPSGLRTTVTYALTPDVADSLRIYGVTDLAGNQMAPELAFGLVASNATAPAINMGASAAMSVSGPDNDTVLLEFDEPIHPSGLTNPDNYTMTDGGGAIDISNVRLTPVGDDSVMLSLGSASNLQTAQTYTLTADGLRSQQGIPTGAPVTSGGLVAGGDAAAPTVSAGDVRLDPTDALSVLVEFNEAVAATSPATANFSIAGNTTDAAALVHPRVVRVTFQNAPAMGENLDITAGALTDLAGNVAGAPASIAIDAADAAAPTVSLVTATGDATAAHSFEVTFSEPVNATEALDLANYAVLTVGSGAAVSLTGASAALDSGNNRVRVALPFGNYLDPGETLRVTTSNVSDVSGNAIVPAASDALIGGDTTAPSSATAFVNKKLDALGRVVEVTFDDAMNVSMTTTLGAWSGSGGQAAVQVLSLNRFRFRVTLDAAIGAAETLSVTTPTDVSNNTGATIVVDPVE